MPRHVFLVAPVALSLCACGPDELGQDVSNVDEHVHKEVSYEKVFRPVVESMAEGSFYGKGVKVGFDLVTDFARTDFAHHSCLDSPDLWGLEMSAGANIGVGLSQGLEVSFEGGDIKMNCLSQVELRPQVAVGARVNLIRHLGQCHAEGENLEDTLFVELGAGVSTSFGVDLNLGVAYTAGLRKGVLNRTLPAYLGGTFHNMVDVVERIVRGQSVFAPEPSVQGRMALCEAASDLFDEHLVPAGDAAHAAKLNAFLTGYVEANTHCPGLIEDIVALDHHDEEHEEHDEHGGEEHGEDEHEHGHEHEADLHGWTVCNDFTLKNALGLVRGKVAQRQQAATGLAKNALKQLELRVALLDDLFSGCDHIEFQLSAGVGIETPATVEIGIESHNYYGTLSFDGTDEELGSVLAQTLDANTFRDPSQIPGLKGWAYDKVCTAVNLLPGFGVFGLLPGNPICEMVKISGATLGLVETLRNDPRFTAEFPSKLSFWGVGVPLPKSPLLNYAVNCTLGPARNALELLFY